MAVEKEEAEARRPTAAVLDGGGAVRAELDEVAREAGLGRGRGRGSGRPAVLLLGSLPTTSGSAPRGLHLAGAADSSVRSPDTRKKMALWFGPIFK